VLLNNLADHLNLLKAEASSLIHQAMEQVSSVDNYLIDSIGNSVGSPITMWLTQHPRLAWLVNHPLMALLIGLVATILLVRLLLTIYRAIAVTIDRLWLAILRSPLFLLKFLFGWEKPKTVSSNTTVTNYEVTNDSQQLQEIMNRLDQIQQQQQEIIQELALLRQQPLTIEPQPLRLVEKKISN
jgi:hypothetical protein